MKAINKYIKEGFYKNIGTPEITLDMLNDFIESTAKKYGFEFVGENWKTPSKDGGIEPQIRKYDSKYHVGRINYCIGFNIRENTNHTSQLFLYFETLYDYGFKKPYYIIDLQLVQPTLRKNYNCQSFKKGFYSRSCDITYYPEAQEHIEKVISTLSKLNKTFENMFNKEVDKIGTFSKASFGKILNHFSEFLY